LAGDALFNKTVLIATTDRGRLDASEAARNMVELHAGLPSQEMEFQIALDLVRRGDPSGLSLLGQVADRSMDAQLKSRARLAAAEWNMKEGKGDDATKDLTTAVHENSQDPEREEYLTIFLKDTGRKSDVPGVIDAARAFLQAHPASRFVPEVHLKLAEALLSSGDVQGARVEFEQLASTGSGTEVGRRALFLAAQSAARMMDPASLDDSLMLYERVAETGTNDQLVWQARLQEGALKNAQNLPLESLAIYDKILSFQGAPGAIGPDLELRAATLMAKADTQHQLGASDPAQEREALKTLQQIAGDPAMPLRWRNEALCKSGLILEKLGEGDAALAAYYQAFKNPRTNEPEQLWHDKAAFDAARLLEGRKQWSDAVSLYEQILSEGGPRAAEAKSRLAKLRLENFLWEN
jgi:tetratricopeptide (TPR) repeat protein